MNGDPVDPALAARIAAIEDRQAIVELVHGYANAVRVQQTDRCVAMMTDDAVVEVHNADPDLPGGSLMINRFTGHAEIRRSFGEVAGQSAIVWPMIHNLQIILLGDAASSECVMVAAIWPHGKSYVGAYRDSYRRTAAGWKFATRTHVVFGDDDGNLAKVAYQSYLAAKSEIGDD